MIQPQHIITFRHSLFHLLLDTYILQMLDIGENIVTVVVRYRVYSQNNNLLKFKKYTLNNELITHRHAFDKIN